MEYFLEPILTLNLLFQNWFKFSDSKMHPKTSYRTRSTSDESDQPKTAPRASRLRIGWGNNVCIFIKWGNIYIYLTWVLLLVFRWQSRLVGRQKATRFRTYVFRPSSSHTHTHAVVAFAGSESALEELLLLPLVLVTPRCTIGFVGFSNWRVIFCAKRG